MLEQQMNRRQWIRGGSAATLAIAAARPQGGSAPRRFRLEETAGLRRFGYPVHAELGGIPKGTSCALTQDGKPVPAQFRPAVDRSGAEVLSLDFNVSIGPLESRVYEIRTTNQAQPGAEPGHGLRVDPVDGGFRVTGTGMTYEVPMNLGGFLGKVSDGTREYLGRGSGGFWIGTLNTNGNRQKSGPLNLRGTISRQGPLAVGLRYDGHFELCGRRHATFVELTFPASKSWVEVNWTLEAAEPGRSTELGLDLDLAVSPAPTLVDLGASGTVYSTLEGEERISLNGTPAGGWEILRGDGPQSVVFARAPRGQGRPATQLAEGWAHVMDATRCTAAAVAGFGVRTSDRIEVSASGRLRVTRRYAEGADANRTLKAWFHFVGMPVQVGAVTSPQSMLAPLKVEWLDETTGR